LAYVVLIVMPVLPGPTHGPPPQSAPSALTTPRQVPGPHPQSAPSAMAGADNGSHRWDEHGKWAAEAYRSLCGEDEQLTVSRIRDRPMASWVRSLLFDTTVRGHVPPSRMIRTTRVVALLSAQAAWKSDGQLSLDQFDACTRVLVEPSRDSVPEEELSWTLVDAKREGRVRMKDAADQVRALWTAMCIPFNEEAALEVAAEVERKDGGWLTAARYRAWFRECWRNRTRGTGRVHLTPREAASGGQTPWNENGPMRSARSCDQVLRSIETGQRSIFGYCGDRLLDLSEPVRDLEPSHNSGRKRPGRAGREDLFGNSSGSTAPAVDNGSGSAAQRLPSVEKKKAIAIDWEAQEEWWTRKQDRLWPYMRVKASYLKYDGEKAEAVGTLLTGWGVRNQASKVPHSMPPKGVRRSQAPTAEQPPGLADMVKARDEENFVVVLINDIERLVPREWVKPLPTMSVS